MTFTRFVLEWKYCGMQEILFRFIISYFLFVQELILYYYTSIFPGLKGNESIEVTPADYEGPLSSVPTEEIDYLLTKERIWITWTKSGTQPIKSIPGRARKWANGTTRKARRPIGSHIKRSPLHSFITKPGWTTANHYQIDQRQVRLLPCWDFPPWRQSRICRATGSQQRRRQKDVKPAA